MPKTSTEKRNSCKGSFLPASASLVSERTVINAINKRSAHKFARGGASGQTIGRACHISRHWKDVTVINKRLLKITFNWSLSIETIRNFIGARGGRSFCARCNFLLNLIDLQTLLLLINGLKFDEKLIFLRLCNMWAANQHRGMKSCGKVRRCCYHKLGLLLRQVHSWAIYQFGDGLDSSEWKGNFSLRWRIPAVSMKPRGASSMKFHDLIIARRA